MHRLKKKIVVLFFVSESETKLKFGSIPIGHIPKANKESLKTG